MTKAFRNLHENLVAIAHLMKTMRSTMFSKSIRCFGAGGKGIFLGVFYLETDHRTDLLLVIVFLKQTKKA